MSLYHHPPRKSNKGVDKNTAEKTSHFPGFLYNPTISDSAALRGLAGRIKREIAKLCLKKYL